MNYEEIKQSIYNYLVSKGFTQHDDMFVLERNKVVQTVVINGQPQQRTQKEVFTLTCLGEGWISDQETKTKEKSKPLIGWNVNINRFDSGDFWVYDLEDFNNTIKL